MMTIFNPAPFGKISRKAYQLCEIITPNETEAEQITNISLKGKRDIEKAMNKIRDLGIVRLLCLTLRWHELQVSFWAQN